VSHIIWMAPYDVDVLCLDEELRCLVLFGKKSNVWSYCLVWEVQTKRNDPIMAEDTMSTLKGNLKQWQKLT